jgi:hypothetical protein
VYLDIWVAFIVFEPDIVMRPVLLDQVHLQDQGPELIADDDPVDIRDVFNQLPGLWIVLRVSVEIGSQPVAQVDRFTDVDHLASLVLHQIAAGLYGRCIEHILDVG